MLRTCSQLCTHRSLLTELGELYEVPGTESGSATCKQAPCLLYYLTNPELFFVNMQNGHHNKSNQNPSSYRYINNFCIYILNFTLEVFKYTIRY